MPTRLDGPEAAHASLSRGTLWVAAILSSLQYPLALARELSGPARHIAFALKHGAGLGPALAAGLFGDLSEDVVDAVLAEAGRFATDIIAPLNRSATGTARPFKDGAVTTPPGWNEAYRAWAGAGWNGLTARPNTVARACRTRLKAACIEMWNAASHGLRPRPAADGRPRSTRSPSTARRR